MERGIQDIQTIQRVYLQTLIQPGDIVVDATAGLGRDTVFLADCVGPCGRVYAFDIQEEALNATRSLLVKQGLDPRVELILASHTELLTYVPNGVKAVVFNLGYLPGSDHQITTKASSTMKALNSVIKILKPKGIICLTVYRGHDDGMEESQTLINHFSAFSKKDFSVFQGRYINQGELSPYWIIIQKNREDIE
ncbi:MAG: hypothetical protein APF84_14260 [Gracilibacter sp. BRH_c7a]|nr:MAG: hypothetical protein APF84_14260 [Gracilibacter sp. BRH_c7a]